MSTDSEFQDRYLTCIDCKSEFTWSAREQEFFREKGFAEPPKRCKDCRQARKNHRADFDKKGSRK